MPTVLLLDDRVSSRVSGKPESSLQGFAERLANKDREGYECHAPLMLNERGFGMDQDPIETVTEKFLDFVEKYHADAVVMDMEWWGDPRYGQKLWESAKASRLSIPDRRVVFVTQMVGKVGRTQIVKDLDLDPRQVCWRDTNGIETAAAWLRENL